MCILKHGDKYKGHIVIPYTQGLGESIKKICGKYDIQTTSRVIELLRIYWSNPKTRILQTARVGPSTGISVGKFTCDEEYRGETSRTFGERYKEPLKEPSPTHQPVRIQHQP